MGKARAFLFGVLVAFLVIGKGWCATVTPRLGLTVPAYSDQNWDVQLRNDFNIIDSSVAVSSNTPVLNASNAFNQTQTIHNGNLVLDSPGNPYGITLSVDPFFTFDRIISGLGDLKILTSSSSITTQYNIAAFYFTDDSDHGIELFGESGTSPQLKFLTAANNSNFLVLQSSVSMAAPLTLTLPSVAGSDGQTLLTDASGNLSFDTPSLTSKTHAQIVALTPKRTGQPYYCSDCSTVPVCVSTGTAVGAFSLITNKGSACQ